MIPRLSKVGIFHILSALSLHAVMSTASPSAFSLVSSSAVIPDGWPCWLVTPCSYSSSPLDFHVFTRPSSDAVKR